MIKILQRCKIHFSQALFQTLTTRGWGKKKDIWDDKDAVLVCINVTIKSLRIQCSIVLTNTY